MHRSAIWGLAVAGVLALALTLRLWGAGFGLPYAYHPDEHTYINAALNLGVGIIGRETNPTGFSNLEFGEYAGYFLAGRAAGAFKSAADFERAYRSDPTLFFLLGRLTSIVFGTANVLVVFWLGKQVHSRSMGLLAALFLAVAFLHVRDSHYAVPDIAMGFFASLSTASGVVAVQQRSRRYVSLSAAACGFAIAAKWSAWPLVTVPILALFYRWRSENGTTRLSTTAVDALMVLVSGISGFAVGGFQILLRPALYFEYAIRELQAGEGGGFGVWQIDTVAGWLFYLKTFAYGLGMGLLVLVILGCLGRLGQAVGTKDRASIVLLSFPLFYYLIMGSSRHYFARYILPLIPFAALLAAEGVMIAKARLSAWHAGFGSGLALVLTLGAIVQPLVWSTRLDVLLTRQDTRTLAKVWIESNIPEGKKIAVDWSVYGPPLSTRERAVPNSDKVYELALGGPLLSTRDWAVPNSDKAFGVALGETGLASHPVAWYREQGYDYMIASSFVYNIPLVNTKQDTERRAFYASLDRELALVQEFRPYAGNSEPPFIFDEVYGPAISLWQRDRPGPTLKIYRLDLHP